jgi:phage terminase large subunit-like protein
MKDAERGIRQRLKADFPHYAQRCLKIRTKEGRIQPFELNGAQRLIHQRLEEQLEKTGRVRALILKGRQQGCSTYVQGRFYWKVTHREGVRAFILTHLEEATRNIHGIVKRFHESCPWIVRPQATLVNSRELVFGRLDSGYAVGTANSPGVGRSSTLQYFHGSEVAYWAHAEDHVSGILQAVADAKETEVILESTSAGAGGLFYKLCQEAKKEGSEYQFIFVAWFMQDEYRKTPPDGFTLDADEDAYKARHGLDDAQMCWRRAKIAELGSLMTFRREYPATPDEAFHADRPGALWSRAVIERNRVRADELPQMKRVVVAIDPAVTASQKSDSTGIIVAGLGTDGHGYVLEDLTDIYKPADWARAAIAAFDRHKADRIIAEVNQGGDMVEHTLRTVNPDVPYKSVHASRGKVTRAEPVAALDEQGRIHHAGIFAALEDQMCRFDVLTPDESPDRVDARVWALTELMLGRQYGGPKVWS